MLVLLLPLLHIALHCMLHAQLRGSCVHALGATLFDRVYDILNESTSVSGLSCIAIPLVAFWARAQLCTHSARSVQGYGES